MQFSKTPIAGLLVVKTTPHADERGYFARTFCEFENQEADTPFHVCQTNISQNTKRGTLRGLHYQGEPKPDPKMVRCIRGAVWDVVVDLRQGSASYLTWFGRELSAENKIAMLIPGGCAHGFISLHDDTELLYLMGEHYVADLACGVRWNDPAFAIDWPIKPVTMGDRDASYPDFIQT